MTISDRREVDLQDLRGFTWMLLALLPTIGGDAPGVIRLSEHRIDPGLGVVGYPYERPPTLG